MNYAHGSPFLLKHDLFWKCQEILCYFWQNNRFHIVIRKIISKTLCLTARIAPVLWDSRIIPALPLGRMRHLLQAIALNCFKRSTIRYSPILWLLCIYCQGVFCLIHWCWILCTLPWVGRGCNLLSCLGQQDVLSCTWLRGDSFAEKHMICMHRGMSYCSEESFYSSIMVLDVLRLARIVILEGILSVPLCLLLLAANIILGHCKMGG